VLDDLDDIEAGLLDKSTKLPVYMKPRLAFWLWMDAQLQAIRCACNTCPRDQGVPLARVLVSMPERESNKPCRIYSVMDHPPLRRNLKKDDCWPAEVGCINLAQYIWQQKYVVMQDLGLSEADVIQVSADDGEIFEIMKASGRFLQKCPEDRVYVVVLRESYLGNEIVIGFSRTGKPNGGSTNLPA